MCMHACVHACMHACTPTRMHAFMYPRIPPAALPAAVGEMHSPSPVQLALLIKPPFEPHALVVDFGAESEQYISPPFVIRFCGLEQNTCRNPSPMVSGTERATYYTNSSVNNPRTLQLLELKHLRLSIYNFQPFKTAFDIENRHASSFTSSEILEVIRIEK